jgi:uncharacterized membrane protein YeaQ/YmgE (transglycosylase-associated protein family)
VDLVQSLGFGPIGTDVLWAVILCLLVLGLVIGWVSDSVLGAAAFGLFGNSALAVIGACSAIFLVLRYGWMWIRPDILSMSGTSVVGAFGGILAMALLRRAAS